MSLKFGDTQFKDPNKPSREISGECVSLLNLSKNQQTRIHLLEKKLHQEKLYSGKLMLTLKQLVVAGKLDADDVSTVLDASGSKDPRTLKRLVRETRL